MKALYIHGLDSSPNKEKLEIMREAGLEPIALHLDYRTHPNPYEELKKEALSQKVEVLVGSSLGGYFAFWLGEELGLPAFLLNPAMTIDRSLPLAINHIKEHKAPLRYVAIGAKDDVINPVLNLEFFQNLASEACYQRVITCDWLKHVIDLETFATLLDWFLSGLKNRNRFPEFNE